MTEPELGGDSRHEERRHDEADHTRSAVTALEEEREKGESECCPHPLNRHNDGQTAQSLLCTALSHDVHATGGVCDSQVSRTYGTRTRSERRARRRRRV